MNLFQQLQKLQHVTLVCDHLRGTQPCQSCLTLPISMLGDRELVCPGCGNVLGQPTTKELKILFETVKGAADQLRKLDMHHFHVRFEDV